MENISYLICLLTKGECYGLEALLQVYLKEKNIQTKDSPKKKKTSKGMTTQGILC